MAETLVLDPTSEDAANTQLTLTDAASGLDVLSQKYRPPDRKRLFIDLLEGFGNPLVGSGYGNAEIELVVRCYGTSMRTAVKSLQAKVGKLQQQGGTYKRTLSDSTVIVWDLQDAEITDFPADNVFVNQSSVNVTIVLTTRYPVGRGPETQLATFTETTNPEAVFAFAAPLGDLPALGRLEVTEAQAQNQAFLQWGMRSGNYGTATTNALSFAGTSRIAYNGSTALAVSGAVSGTLLNQGTLTNSFAAVCGMASTGNAYPTHIGEYEVWARLYMGTANAGTVTAALEWAQGDLMNYTRNDGTVLAPSRAGGFMHVNLGRVKIEKALAGAQRWDGRLIAKSTTVGDGLGVDRFYFPPVDDGYGEARAVTVLSAPTTWAARDAYAHAAGTLNGKVAPTGGTWVWQGSGTDFATTGAGHVTRSAAALQTMLLGTAVYSTIALQQDVKISDASASDTMTTLLFRYVDANNYASIEYTLDEGAIRVQLLVAGAGVASDFHYVPVLAADTYHTLRVFADPSGQITVWEGTTGHGFGQPVLRFQHSSLATGGALDDGTVGFSDTSNLTFTRTYKNFEAWVPAPDAAIFASRKATLRHNSFQRQDSAGTAYGDVGDYRGGYLRIATVATAGSAQMLVKSSRGIPEYGADAGIDDTGGTLWATPLYFNSPDA